MKTATMIRIPFVTQSFVTHPFVPKPNVLAAAAALLLTSALAAPFASAQSAPPDSGQILRQNAPRPSTPPQPDALLRIAPDSATAAVVPAGGATVMLQTVQFSGNSVLSTDQLQALVANAPGQSFDLADLRGLADRVTAHYRAAGYPFARAVLPPQDLARGNLTIQVVEGRYGRVAVVAATPGWQDAGLAHLTALKPGEVITTASLERAVLLLGEQPGVRATAVMQPGAAVGTGDLVVSLDRTAPLVGMVSLDNQGNRYSGQNRLLVSADWNNPWRLGDQLSLRAMVSDASLWLGSLTYASPLPVGDRALRASVSLAHTSYQLGKEFNALDATGTAQVAAVGLAWPVLRSSTANLRLGAQLQHKRLRDRQIAMADDKHSTSLPVSLDFDLRDGVANDGLTSGSLTWTPGRLALSAASLSRDQLGTQGRFNRVNIDMVRQQKLSPLVQAWLRGSAQWADGNLDSSERVSLGGANGVRAYPNGEGTGDQGWLVQAETRVQLGAFAPFVFADAGAVRISAHPLASGGINQRKLAGAGMGVRWQQGAFDAQLAVAWRTHGGAAQSEGGSTGQPRAWAQAAWHF